MSSRKPEDPRPAVFLDRDGTLIEDVDFLTSPAELAFLPGAADAVARLNRAGFLVVLVTNQSGIARGYLTEDTLAAVHEEMSRRLAEHGAHLDLVLHCPHHPSEGVPPLRRSCTCRKPEPGLLLAAAELLPIDLGRSWMVGDADRDLEAARRASVPHRILVATGKGTAEHARLISAGTPPERFEPDLAAAVDRILASREP